MCERAKLDIRETISRAWRSATKYQQLLIAVVFQMFSTSLTSVLSAGKAQVRARTKSRSKREDNLSYGMDRSFVLSRVYCHYRYQILVYVIYIIEKYEGLFPPTCKLYISARGVRVHHFRNGTFSLKYDISDDSR